MTPYLADVIAPYVLPVQSPLGGVALAGALVLISVIETPFIKVMCGAGWKRAIAASLIVNGITTLMGVFAPRVPLETLIWLLALPFSVLVEWILLEKVLVSWLGPVRTRRRFIASVAMNVTSYAVLWTLVFNGLLDGWF